MKTLKQILSDENITIASFAKGISATSQQVCNWFERGNIPKGYILPISKHLNMSIEKVIKLKASSRSLSTKKDQNKVSEEAI